jgi:uncharacterized protein YbjT (DUF2867 family)
VSHERGKVLLSGATGFVGRAVQPRLVAAGWEVRSLTRRRAAEQPRSPGVEWVEGDVARPGDVARAMEGVRAALFLVHGMGEGADFERREVEEARQFALAAGQAGVSRLAYLGGVAPAGLPSPHLRSRLAVGEALRQGPVPALELRASMIIGHGSLSWLIVRDLAARLPMMVLPAWLRSRTQPVAIDDVVAALVAALDVPLEGSASYDLPGPEIMSCREILDETARQLHLAPPRALELPVLTPRLSSHWVHLVTRARWSVAREVVLGLTHDLLARDDSYWGLIGHGARLPFAEAARRALAAEAPASGPWGAFERLLRWRADHRAHA